MQGGAIVSTSLTLRFVGSNGPYFPSTYSTFFPADNFDELGIVSSTSFASVLAFVQGFHVRTMVAIPIQIESYVPSNDPHSIRSINAIEPLVTDSFVCVIFLALDTS